MRWLVLTVCLLTLLCAPVDAKLKPKYDKISGYTYFNHPISGAFGLGFFQSGTFNVAYTFNPEGPVDYIVLRFTRSARNTHLLDFKNLFLLVDNNRYTLQRDLDSYNSNYNVYSNQVSETMDYPINYQQFRELVLSDSASIRMGGSTLDVKESAYKRLKEALVFISSLPIDRHNVTKIEGER